MSQNNLNIMQVLWDNVILIISGMTSWVFALGGFYDITRSLFTLAALVLSCMVSAATLYKIFKDFKKSGAKKGKDHGG